MGNKGGSRHLKRHRAPAFWPMPRKRVKWAIKPRAGPHGTAQSMPIGLVLRDLLRIARTGREARLLLSQGKIKIDGRTRTDHKYAVGLMDVIEIPESSVRFRVVPMTRKGLGLVAISKDEASFKLCKIADKSTVKKGNIQLNLHDSRNLVVVVEDARKPSEDIYGTRDSVQLSLPEQKIMKHLKLGEGAYVVATGGANVGRHGQVVSIQPGSSASSMIVEIAAAEGDRFRTIDDYVFVVGEDTSLVELGGK